jgi:hypothetical protein
MSIEEKKKIRNENHNFLLNHLEVASHLWLNSSGDFDIMVKHNSMHFEIRILHFLL